MAYSKGEVALIVASVCVAPLIAFAVLWTGVLAVLFVMWLWYSGSLIPVSFIALGFGYYLVRRHDVKPARRHLATA